MATMLEKASRLAGNALIRPLTARSKRRPNLWLFGHQGGEFAGNSKFLYLWLLSHRPDIDPVWITDIPEVFADLKAHGLPVCRRGTARAVKAALEAGVYLYCHGPEDVSITLGGGAVLVNLWHGIGLKTTQFGDPHSNATYYSNSRLGWMRRTIGLGSRLDPDLVIATSKFTQAHFADQFRLPLDRCPPCGYSRLDVGIDRGLREQVERVDGDRVNRLREGDPSKVYVYAPTYRDTGRDFLADALPDLDRLNASLEARDAMLYLKLHRRTTVPGGYGSARVNLWPRDTDLYSAFPLIDSLITDYSSLHYDWIFQSDRGAILYTFDQNEYQRNDRELLYPFDENVAGWRARTFDELAALIETGRGLEAHPDAPRIRKKFWGDASGPASPRIVMAIEDRLRAR